jgi:membrane-associated protein
MLLERVRWECVVETKDQPGSRAEHFFCYRKDRRRSSTPSPAAQYGDISMIELIRHILHQLYDVRGLVEWGGVLAVCIIVFVETGLFVGFFLPGDSLLVTAGVIAAIGDLKVVSLLTFVTLCAIAGDQLGYWIGRRAGMSLYERQDSRFFKKQHLERAHAFYEKYGGKTVIMARFVPIVRTFCPPVAGAARMSYARYVAYDIVGGFLWVWGMILLGYTLGRKIPHVEQKIHYVIAAVIVISLLPVAIQALRLRAKKDAEAVATAEAK